MRIARRLCIAQAAAVAATLARRGDWLAAAATTGVTGLLVCPISWSHHWVWVIPALGVLLRDGRRRAAAGGAAMFVLAPNWWAPHLPPGLLTTLLRNAYALAGLWFLGYAVGAARRVRRPVPAPAARTVLAG